MALDTTKKITKVTYNGVEIPLNVGEPAYQIVTAEVPNITINLYDNNMTLVATQDTGENGGKVTFSLNQSGTYTLYAESGDTQIWSAEVTIDKVGEYNVKTGKTLGSYTPEELHQALQGGYFSLMFALKDTFVLSQTGNILNSHRFFVENITKTQDGKEIVDFRMANKYTGGNYNINPVYAYLESANATSWSSDYSSNGGYKYSDMRKRMMKAGEEVWSQAQSIKPDNSTVANGIPFSQMKYTDGDSVSAIYSYDKATDTFTPLTEWAAIASRNTYFVKGYFKNVGAIDEATFNSGNYYTYATSTYLYTPATSYVGGTTYYGFYEHLQEDGIFANALATSAFSSYLARFSDFSSAGLTQTTSVTETNDFADIPSIEEITGLNRTMTLFSGVSATNANAYNIAGEGTKKPCYDEFKIQTIGSEYWSRSAYSSSSTNFCYINIYGYIYNNFVYNTIGVRLGFRLN